MSCTTTYTELINLQFAQISDGSNWNTNSTESIITEAEGLRLKPTSANNYFTRVIGVPTKTRVRIKIYASLLRSNQNQSEETLYQFQLLQNGLSIDTFSFHTSQQVNELKEQYIVRDYNVEAGQQITLKVLSTAYGYEKALHLKYAIVEEYEYCSEDVRTYFALDTFFDRCKDSLVAGIKANSLKIDNVETLTVDFHTYNDNAIGTQNLAYLFGTANIDGSSRTDQTPHITFNPFVNDFGLNYDDAEYYRGLPISQQGNFGEGLYRIGVDIPVIFNEMLQEKRGVIFIDIDYTKDYLFQFDLILNEQSNVLMDDYTYYHKYYIKWNSITCKEEFYYIDEKGERIDQIANGFLYAVAPEKTKQTVTTVPCNQSVNYSGQTGTYSYIVELGTELGITGIDYDAYGIPDKFEIIWDGNVINSKYVGSSTYNQQLINAGIPPSDIATGNPSTGQGELTFNKHKATPTTAEIRVTAPLGGTGWLVKGKCPNGVMVVIVQEGSCGNQSNPFFAFMEAIDTELGAIQTGMTIYSDVNLTTPIGGSLDVTIAIVTVNNAVIPIYKRVTIASGTITNIQDC